MERCPNCNARIKESDDCYRCGFDFSLPLQCEKAAERLYLKALSNLEKGDLDQAGIFADKASFLDNTPSIRKLNTYLLLKKMYHA